MKNSVSQQTMISKKKIIQISLGYGQSGCAKFAVLSSIGFQRQGHEIILIGREGSLTEKRAREAGLSIETLPQEPDDTVDFAALKTILEEHRPEFVIAHDSKERKYLMKFRRQEGQRFYGVAFRSIVPSSFPFFSSIPCNLWLDLIVACSKGVAKSLMHRGILPSKIKIAYNGIALAEKTPTPICKDSMDVPLEAKIIGISSWFHKKRKGFDILFSAVSKGLPFPFRMLMLGVHPTDRAQVEEMAQSYGISKAHLIFPGYVEDVWPYYAAMDVFVLPSRREGFSLSLLEAMACGLPVIASDIRGNNEAVPHNLNGLFFQLSRTDELRSALIKVIEEPDLTLRLGKAAQRTVLEKYTYDKVVIAFDQVLEELRRSRRLDPRSNWPPKN